MTEQKKKINLSRSSKIMLSSIVCGILLIVTMFILMGVNISAKSASSIDDIGHMFMSGMGRQTTLRYDAVLEQRTSMVEGMTKVCDPRDPTANDELSEAAQAGGFTYLAFMDDEGNSQILLGSAIDLDDSQSFTQSLITDKKSKISSAHSEGESATADNGFVIIGVPTLNERSYTMESGKKSVALVAGMSNSEIMKMLSEKNTDNSDEQRFDTHIINRHTGDYVMLTNDDNHQHSASNSYYDYIRGTFELSVSETESIIETLQQRMADNRIYSTIINSPSRKHMYCERLSDSEWYIVMVMRYSDIDVVVNDFSATWTAFTITTCVVVMAVLVILFGIYYYFNYKNLKTIQAARASAEKASKAKSEFLSNMSHDIRTPMNAIVGMTAIATANIDNQAQVADCLGKISLSSRHLLGLINDVLDMAKIESGKMTLSMEKISLRETVDSISVIVQPQMSMKKQSFDIYIHDIIAENVYCDNVRLNQVLLNLLSNAHKFTPEEGKIEFSLYQEVSPKGEHYVRTHIIVQDNGIGMSPEFVQQMFDYFTREDKARVSNTEGAGLGMSITKYIIDSMHGTIDIESKSEIGTKFHVTVDLEIAEDEDAEMTLPDWKMLVVDNDQMLCDTALASLETLGVNADSALDGASAIDMAIKAQNAGKGYEIVLMDSKLSGMNSIETAKRMSKALGRSTPVMLFAAYDWSEIEREARAAGISGFVSKPLFRSTLYYGLKPFAPESEDKPKTEKKAPVSLKGKRLLVAEDNDLNWEIAQLLLESKEFYVEHAPNGQVCVDMLLSNKPDYYDAILMDVRMPVMNGLEATQIIRNLKEPYRSIPIIAMTADAFTEDKKRCLEYGMNAHIAKPIDLDTVIATVAKHIKNRK